MAERVLQAIGKPFTVAGHALQTSASVGIAFFPSDGADATALVRNADVAMYRAKRGGGNRHELFDTLPAMSFAAPQRCA